MFAKRVGRVGNSTFEHKEHISPVAMVVAGLYATQFPVDRGNLNIKGGEAP